MRSGEVVFRQRTENAEALKQKQVWDISEIEQCGQSIVIDMG